MNYVIMTKNIKKILGASLALLLLTLAAATVVEKICGSGMAHRYVYGAWWFVALWAVVGVSAFAYIFHSKLYKNMPAFTLHCAFGLILVGALITFVSAERGYLHLRQGQTSNVYISEKDTAEHSLPFGVKLVLFDIEYHAGTSQPADFISFLKVDTTLCRVSMNKIYKHSGYRFYQMDYDRDEMGSILLVSRDTWGIGVTYAGYLLLGLSMLCLLRRRIGWKGLLCLVVAVGALWFDILHINPMTPVLRTPMLAAHVSVIMAAYGLLSFITVRSIIALCKPKYADVFYLRNSTLLYPALFLLAAGIFIGAVWANISWGRYWGWDAKETWALITLLVYAMPMHIRGLPFFNIPRKFHIFCVLAFFTMLMTFFGVTFLLGGIHSYV
jgi:ABC-type transport system involved in cytochrome c biogenesis permease subunit